MFFVDVNICEVSSVLKVIKFVTELFKYAFFIVPIILILMLVIDFSKAVMSKDESEMKKNFNIAARRLVMCLCLFYVPVLVRIAFSLLENSASQIMGSYNTCLENIDNISFYEEIEETKKAQAEADYVQSQTEKLNEKKHKMVNYTLKAYAASDTADLNSNNIGVGGIVNGKTYNLTTYQLKKIAAMVAHEQGSSEGQIAEVSLMANRYELSGSSKSFYEYITTSKWFASRGAPISDATKSSMAAVKIAIENGNRSLPLYVNEHDCWNCNKKKYCHGHKGDICTLNNNGSVISSLSSITNKDNYIPDVTKVHTVYQSSSEYWTFYTFPSNERSDPFGYTPGAYKRIKGGN